MADFITKKENFRRLLIIIFTSAADVAALAVGIIAYKGVNDLTSPEKKPNINTVYRDLETAKEDLEKQKSLYYGYAKNIGWFSDGSSSVSSMGTQAIEHASLRTFLDRWADELARLDAAKYKFKKWDGSGQGDTLTLKVLFEKLLEKENEYKTKIGDLTSQIEAERTKEKTIRTETDQANAAALAVLAGPPAPGQPSAGLIGELIKNMRDLNGLQKQHAEELATLDKDSIDAQTKATEIKNENVRKRAAAEAVKAEYRRRIFTIMHHRDEARERREPDGKILSLEPGRKLAYINLLRKDRLFKGTRFYAFSLEKGGQKLDKGVIEVIEVREDNSSICAVISTKYPEWPLKEGDQIYNELYEGGRARHIAFAGRFTGRLSNEEAANLIREFGDFFQDKVDEKTNYVVVAEGYEEDPNFKAAQEFGIKILREKILYDYLGVKRE